MSFRAVYAVNAVIPHPPLRAHALRLRKIRTGYGRGWQITATTAFSAEWQGRRRAQVLAGPAPAPRAVRAKRPPRGRNRIVNPLAFYMPCRIRWLAPICKTICIGGAA